MQVFGIPNGLQLPEIRSSSENYFDIKMDDDDICSIFNNVPVTACLADQQSALVGNRCFNPGQAKNTYGTGCFLLFNTGNKIHYSSSGLLTTIAYQFGPSSPITYALEVKFFEVQFFF